MASKLNEIESEALCLPEESRAQLAKSLLLSLEATAQNEDTDRVWAEEAERRYQEIQRGEVIGQDSEEVFREARSRLK